jgi:hypothetical protein
MTDCEVMTVIINCKRDMKERRYCDRSMCPVSNGFDCVFWLKQQLVWAREAKEMNKESLYSIMNHGSIELVRDCIMTDA